VSRPGWQLHGRVELPSGTVLSVRAATPAQVTFTGTVEGEAAEIEIRSPAGSRRAELVAGRVESFSFSATPDAARALFTVSALRGRAVLDDFRIVAQVPRP
jgi:hypothetical protein